ncbi:MAG: hypothetical protein JWN48_5072 [Myxococcaceae bacterium]|nr:hypothetical protein [Myxococcaceae bacterium]
MKLSPYLPALCSGFAILSGSRARRRLARLASGLALCLAALSLEAGSSARAQDAAATPSASAGSEPASYRETIREALSEYRARNFPEARALFAEAHALYPNARTLRGLGMTAFELRSYRESIGYLTEALGSKVKPLEGALRTETERLIARAERFVGKLNLTVTPANAAILVDGNQVAHTAGVELVIEVGEHTLEFSAEGYHPETRSLYMKGHETETWNVVLQPIPAPAPVAAAPTPEQVASQAEPEREREPSGPRFVSLDPQRDDEKKPLYKNPWLWTGVGAVVVTAIIVGVAVGASKTELGKTQIGPNTPTLGQFDALQARP